MIKIVMNERENMSTGIMIIGPSGSGKTTICSLLPRFYDVTGGSIRIDGKDIRSLSLESLRNNIGLVQQDVYLFCGSIKDNISYGKPGASIEEIIDAAKKANIHDFIMSLPDGYDSYVGERGTRLSGGQKQLLNLASVVIMQPDVLLLDEPTAGLDPKQRVIIRDMIHKTAKDKIVLVSTHIVSDVETIADEIIIMKQGRIAANGTVEQLVSVLPHERRTLENAHMLHFPEKNTAGGAIDENSSV